ncbi:MAG: hypothetical protein HYX50_01155 [Chloroflexi bacterium]|nr:hypothetical protein [Chloroflexota bacterium]
MNELDHRTNPKPEYMEKAKTRVRVFTPSGIVEGDYSHPPGVRLSDSLRNSATAERYVLLTDVSIRALSGDEIDGGVSTAPFVLLSTAHASLLIPLSDE